MARQSLFALTCALMAPLLWHGAALAQYNASKGINKPMRKVQTRSLDAVSGKWKTRTAYQPPARDSYGNAAGSQYDLAVDGAFQGQTVAVLHLYTGEGFDFRLPRAALKKKGFSVYRWSNAAPSPEELDRGLKKACQLWIVSSNTRMLNDEHLRVIKRFFDSGRGVYIWGDNEPYYADANFVAQGLLGATMKGNVMGNKAVTLWSRRGKAGLLPNHLLTTGLAHLFEGITIATLQPGQSRIRPLLYGSANNMVSAYYDHGGKRAILDGGFTRLFIHWDTAGTARYVKNAAAWLANYERFGKSVLGQQARR